MINALLHEAVGRCANVGDIVFFNYFSTDEAPTAYIIKEKEVLYVIVEETKDTYINGHYSINKSIEVSTFDRDILKKISINKDRNEFKVGNLTFKISKDELEDGSYISYKVLDEEGDEVESSGIYSKDLDVLYRLL